MSSVWEHSRAKGSGLLVLLAIADFANDSGVAWPSIDTIAKKARTGVRRTQDLVKELESLGELQVSYQKARFGCNLYTVQKLHLPRKDSTPQSLQEGCNVESPDCTPGGAIQSLQIAPDPSGTVSTRQEPPYPPQAGGEGSEAVAHSGGDSEKRARGRDTTSKRVFVLKQALGVVESQMSAWEDKKKKRGQLDEAGSAALAGLRKKQVAIRAEMLRVTGWADEKVNS